MSASDDPQQARVCCRTIIGTLNQHSHFATDAFETCGSR
jgi:hypothetical protein